MKFSVTPELAILLKTIRTKNGISAKDLAENVGKSSSYISKLESGDVKNIQKELLTSILTYITEGTDFFGECLPEAVTILNTFIEPERMTSQAWLLQYDVVDRPIHVPPEMVDDLSNRMDAAGFTIHEIVNYANENVDSEMDSRFPENTVLSMPYEEGNRLLVRMNFQVEEIEELFSKKRVTTNYMTLNSLAFTIFRATEFGMTETKLPPDQAVEVLRSTSALMELYNVHSLTGFSHMLSSNEFIERQKPMAWPYENIENSALNEAVRIFNEAMDHDALNTKKALDSFLDALNWDPAFMMKLMSLPFSELEGLSFQNKKQLLEELFIVVDKYNRMSDFEKRMETY